MIFGAAGFVYQEYARDAHGLRARLHRLPPGWLAGPRSDGRRPSFGNRHAAASPAARTAWPSGLARRHARFVGSVTEVRTPSSQIVLTYDDGPDPAGTDRILEALARHDATATFFVLVTRARRYGSLLAEVVSAGHESLCTASIIGA